jgi:hypothetical protein
MFTETEARGAAVVLFWFGVVAFAGFRYVKPAKT